MRANVWSGRNTVQVENVPDPKILNDRDAIVKITSTAICGSDLHLYDEPHPDDEEGRHPRPRVHGRGRRDRPRREEPAGRRPGQVVPSRSRAATRWHCQNELLLALRELESERRDRREDVRTPDVRHLRLLAHHRRLRGRSGRILARAVRRRRATQARGRPSGRAGPLPVGHLPDGLHGRGLLRHQGRGGHRRVRRRPGRPVPDRRAR